MGTKLNYIYCGDCLDVLKTFPNKCIDLVVTSPPYDKLRDYGGYTFNFEKTAEQLYKVLKVGGVIVWVIGDSTIKGSETGTSFKQALYFKKIGFNLHDTMIYKAEKPPLTHNRYEQKFEYMFIFSKWKPKTFNPIKEECKYYGQDKKSRTLRQDSDELGNRSGKGKIGKYKIKGNIWEYAIGGGKSSKDRIAFKHPAIFPEKLARDHILSWSNKSDVVLDPFIGSGTTAVACVELGRNYIGIEINPEYVKIAEQRIKNIIPSLF